MSNMSISEDWSYLSIKQCIGYSLIRMLGFLQQLCYHKIIGEIVWRTAEGKCIPLSKISNNHLLNIINMLKRNNEQPEYLEIFNKEFLKRFNKNKHY